MGKREPDYCGCCGRETKGHSTFWCRECAGHLGAGDYPHERTFYAQHQKPCPFEVAEQRQEEK